jgi:hypothetical protein
VGGEGGSAFGAIRNRDGYGDSRLILAVTSTTFTGDCVLAGPGGDGAEGGEACGGAIENENGTVQLRPRPVVRAGGRTTSEAPTGDGPRGRARGHIGPRGGFVLIRPIPALGVPTSPGSLRSARPARATPASRLRLPARSCDVALDEGRPPAVQRPARVRTRLFAAGLVPDAEAAPEGRHGRRQRGHRRRRRHRARWRHPIYSFAETRHHHEHDRRGGRGGRGRRGRPGGRPAPPRASRTQRSATTGPWAAAGPPTAGGWAADCSSRMTQSPSWPTSGCSPSMAGTTRPGPASSPLRRRHRPGRRPAARRSGPAGC